MTSLLLVLLLTQVPAKTKVVTTENGTGKTVEVGDSTNHAVRVNCVTGCSSGAAASSTALNDGTTTSQKAAVSASGALKVDGSAVTQPVSGSLTISNFPSVQAVTGTFWQATQPVSGPLTDTQLRASAVPVSGTFWQATQPVSGTFWQATQPVSGTVTDNQGTAAASSGAWPMKLVDSAGTNTATVKAASTAAVAADTALVVSGSPNTKLFASAVSTGAATPGSALLVGGGSIARGSAPNGAVAGNLSMLTVDPDSRLYVDTNHPNLWSCNVSAATVMTQCQAAPAASTFLNVADVVLTNGATAQTVQLMYGTGTNCGTTSVALGPAINLPINGTVTINFTQTVKVPVAANAICCKPSGANAFGCWVSGYTSAN